MMGLFGDILGGITSVIPGPVDDAIVGVGKQLFGGGDGGGQQQRGRFPPPPTTGRARRMAQDPGRRGGISGGFDFNPPFGGRPGVGFQGRSSFFEGNGGRGTRTRGGSQVPMMGNVGVQPQVENRPTRRCPTGMVLAKDGLCYPKKLVTKAFRMWPPAKKPPISVSEMNALRAAKRVEKKVKRLGRKITPEGRKTLNIERD